MRRPLLYLAPTAQLRLLLSGFLPLGHAVADAGLVEDVGGVVRAFAQLAAEVLHHGPYRPGCPGCPAPHNACSR